MYGDSISEGFADSLKNGQYSALCKTVFKDCKTTYTWIYNRKDKLPKKNKFDGKDYDHEKVMGQISKVSQAMDTFINNLSVFKT